MDPFELKEIKYIKDIKSQYNIKGIFSFLNEKQKCNMIIYNKQLQNNFGINIENFKKVSGKYKIVEKNGKGKEYSLYTNKLLFEGEYSNGKRNGKGKYYYDNGIIEFEGEYLNGKKNGTGKEYYYNSKPKFEGEYLNGKIWNGKGYDKNGEIGFEIVNGKGLLKNITM